MSKKTKRQVRKTTDMTASAPAAPVSTVYVSSNGSRAGASDFNPDYSVVISDLKRIGTLAGSFFAVIIVLSLILK